MNRRDFLANSILAAGSVIAPRAFAAPAQSDEAETVHLTIHTDSSLGTIAPDFVGLGYEISSVARPKLMSRADSTYVQLVRTLGARGVIRVGGNTSDYASYSPSAPAVSSARGTVVNDAGLRDLGTFLEATGWKLIWGLNLGTGSQADAIAEAKAVRAIAGEKLLVFEIGNEPDLFGRAKHRKPEYSYEDWLKEYRDYKTALREQFPGLPLAGPDAAGKTDCVTRFAADEGKRYCASYPS